MGQLTLLIVYNLINVYASLRLNLKRKKKKSQHDKLIALLGSYADVVLRGNASERLLMSEQRQGKIILYFIPLSGGSVSGLKGQLIFWTGRGFFEFVFVWCWLSFQADQSCDRTRHMRSQSSCVGTGAEVAQY